MNKPNLKLVIAGDGAAGKTTISKKLSGTLQDHNELTMTTGIDFHTLDVSDKTNDAIIWDLGGQEQFRCFQDTFFQNADIIILVFDVTRIDSFFNIDSWLSMVDRNATSQVYLIGNKIDVCNRVVFQEEAEGYALEKDLKYFEFSALTDEGFIEFKKHLINKIKTLTSMNLGEDQLSDNFFSKDMNKQQGLTQKPLKEKMSTNN